MNLQPFRITGSDSDAGKALGNSLSFQRRDRALRLERVIGSYHCNIYAFVSMLRATLANGSHEQRRYVPMSLTRVPTWPLVPQSNHPMLSFSTVSMQSTNAIVICPAMPAL